MTSPYPDLAGNITQTLSAAPELANTPSLALAAAQTADPYTAAQVTSSYANTAASLAATNASIFESNLSNIAASDTGVQPSVGLQPAPAQTAPPVAQHRGILGTIGHWVGDVPGMKALGGVVGGVGQALNKPLQVVQHEYRYLRAVADKRGPLEALLEGSGMALAGIGTTVLTGGNVYAGALAAEGVGDLEGHVVNNDIWQATQTSYRDSTGASVSFGRDIAHALGLSGGAFNVVSGAGDLGFDVVTDPLRMLGKAKTVTDLGVAPTLAQQDGASLARKITSPLKTLRDPLIKIGSTTGPTLPWFDRPGRWMSVDEITDTPDAVIKTAAQRPDIMRALQDLAGKTAGEIATNTQYKNLAPMAKELGAATTPEQVADVLRTNANTGLWTSAAQGLPKLSITRRTATSINQALYSAGTSGKIIGEGDEAVTPLNRFGKIYNSLQSYHPFNLDPSTLELSNKTIDPTDLHDGPKVAQLLRFSQSPAQVSKVMDAYYAGSVGDRVNIIRNGITTSLIAAGVPRDSDTLAQIVRGMDTAATAGSGTDLYALSREGKNLGLWRDPATGNWINSGLFPNQTGKLAMPDFQAMRNIVRSEGGIVTRTTGKADQWLNDHYTASIFKPLALLNLGFATRIGLSELVPGSIEHGLYNIIGSRLAATGEKLTDAGRYNSILGKHFSAFMKAQAGDPAEADALNAAQAGEKIPKGPLTSPQDVAQAAQRMGVKQTVTEARNTMASAAYTMWSATRKFRGRAYIGLSKGLIDDDYRDITHALAIAHQGALVAPSLDAGHHAVFLDDPPDEKVRANLYKAGNSVPDKLKTGDDFQVWQLGSDRHPMMWHSALAEQADDPGQRLMARAFHSSLVSGAPESEADRAGMDAFSAFADSDKGKELYSRLAMAQGISTADFAARRLEALKGVTYGSLTEAPNPALVDAIATGRSALPSVDELHQTYSLDQMPAAVKGRIIQPATGAEKGLQGLLQRGFTKISGTINYLSREPLYVAAVTKEYKFLKPAIDSGLMTYDDALRVSEVRAANNTLRLVHNTALRNQFSDTWRNVLPFYFAQEQALRRYGTLALRNPAAFGDFLLIHHAQRNIGIVSTDDQGQQHALIPGGGVIGDALTRAASTLDIPLTAGLPGTYTGNMSSLSTVLPEIKPPSSSPIFALALNQLRDRFPEIAPDVDKVQAAFGGANLAANQNASLLTTLQPNATINALGTAAFGLRWPGAFATSYAYNIAAAQREADQMRGQAQQALTDGDSQKANALYSRAQLIMPDENASPTERQRALRLISNRTRVGFAVKALFNATSPLSPTYQAGDYQIREDFAALVKANNGDYAKATQQLLAKDPYALPDTVSQSASMAGTRLPTATAQVGQWLADNTGLAKSHPYATAFLLPHDAGQYDQAAFQAEKSVGLRQTRNSGDFLNAVYYANDAPYYYASQTNFYNALDAAKGNNQQTSALRTQWAQFQTGYFSQHPAFAQQVQGNETDASVGAVQTMNELNDLFQSNRAPAGSQTEVVRGLFNSYLTYRQHYVALAEAHQTKAVTALKKQWNDYLDQIAPYGTDNAASQFVGGVLRHLPSPIDSADEQAAA